MKNIYYTYSNIIRVLNYDKSNENKSLMVDINADEKTILSIFDAEREFDLDFIKSYINLVSQNTTGFCITDSKEVKSLAKLVLQEKLPVGYHNRITV